MKRPLRLLAGSIAILLLSPVLAIAAYWAAVFLPRLDDIDIHRVASATISSWRMRTARLLLTRRAGS